MARSVALGVAVAAAAATASTPIAKHVVFILADDLGFNDVSAHGSPQIPTPNIDALISSGMRLDSMYAAPVCSPTRSSILTGRHVSHTGVYMPFSEGSALVVNTSFALLPSFLTQAANVTSHAVGKWHLGVTDNSTLPTSRGFATQMGYWMGAETYTTHDAGFQNANHGAYDWHDTAALGPQAPDLTANGSWSTALIAARAVQLIEAAAADLSSRHMLYVAFQNVHWPLQAPQSYIDRFAGKTGGSQERQMVCAMAAFLDDAVGNITAALQATGLWEDTLVIFQSDNGGPTNLDEGTFSDNFPLRGGKNTLWQGGARVTGAISGGVVPSNLRGSVYNGFVHVTDWLPTLVHAMSGSAEWQSFAPEGQPPFEEGDGLDLWPALAAGAPAMSPRDWLLVETHPTDAQCGSRVHGDALLVGDWKLVRLDTQISRPDENGWFPPPGQDPSSTPYMVRCSASGAAPRTGSAPDPKQCVCSWCLFNVTADPCEYTDLAPQFPGVVAELQERLTNFSRTAVPPVQPSGCAPLRVPLPNGALVWQPCTNN